MDIDDITLNIFFIYCWKHKPKRCQCGCGKHLPDSLNKCCMDHILDKSKYPECKYSKSNIAYYTPDCHSRKTNGFFSNKQLEKYKEAIENYDFIKEESLKFEEKVKNKLYDK